MSYFCLLRAPDKYVPLDWDLLQDGPARAYWLDLFEKVFAEILTHAQAHYGRSAEKRIALARRQFAELIARLRQDPASLAGGRLSIMELDRARDRVLRENRLDSPLEGLKKRHNAAALEQYAQVVRRAHSLRGRDKWQHLVRGVLAGNLLDFGADPAARSVGDEDFAEVVGRVRARPWLVDQFDAFAAELDGAPPAKWAKAIFFVDNAGSDFVLGAIPLARELALAGTQVVLAANERASLNDITVDECVQVVEQLAREDRDLAALIDGNMLQVVGTGNDLPVIDLSDVSDELNEAAADADLVILEGMGRCVETNFDAPLKVSTLGLAVLKNPHVASRLGGQMFDCVCKYAPAPQ